MYDIHQIITHKEDKFLHSIQFYSEKDEIILKLKALRDPESWIEIHYKKVGEDTLVESSVKMDRSRTKEIEVEDKDFVSVFCDDLESLLLHRNTLMDEIAIEVREYNDGYELDRDEEYIRKYLDPIRERNYQGLTAILRYRVQKLQVKELYLKINQENQITSILPYIDPSTVIIFDLTLCTSDPTWTLAEMWSLDFWRLAKPKNVCVQVNKLHPTMLISLKEAFFTNSNLDHVEIEPFMHDEFWPFGYELEEMKKRYNGEPALDQVLELLDKDLPIPNTDQEILTVSLGSKEVDGVFKIIFIRKKLLKEYEDSEEDEIIEGDDEPIQALSEEDPYSKVSRSSEESVQELSIEPKKRCEVVEDLQAKPAINIMNVLENDIIFEKIMEYVEFPGNQILRKVSRDIRQQIDKIKPDPAIKTWRLDVRGFEVEVRIGPGDDFYKDWYLHYAKEGDGCSVKIEYSEKMTESRYIDEDFRIRCLKDFEINMEHQITPFYRFQFGLWDDHDADIDLTGSSIFPFLEVFEEFFRCRTRLKVKHLGITFARKTKTGSQQNEVRKILPFLDPQILESIELGIGYEYGEEVNQCSMEVDEISRLEQWTNARVLIMFNLIILTSIQDMNITHFEYGDITVQTISLEDLRYLKERFQNNSNLIKFKIAFKECTFEEYRNDEMYQFMGIPHIQANPLLRNQRNIWFCRMPNCDNILHIAHFVGQCITFTGVEPSKVPENAWIHR